MKYRVIIPIGILLFLIGSYFFVFIDVRMDGALTEEDGIVENIGAISFLLASLLFFYSYLDSAKAKVDYLIFGKKYNFFFLFLAFLFFVAFGEEISWGQRIFNWSTPEAWGASNLQKETNIHNLNLFKHRTNKGEGGGDLLSYIFVFSPGRLFFYIWFFILVIIPGVAYFSKKWKDKLNNLRIPVAPMWIGLLMLANLVISKSFGFLTRNYPLSTYSSTDEFSETNYAILIAILAIFWVKNKPFFQSR